MGKYIGRDNPYGLFEKQVLPVDGVLDVFNLAYKVGTSSSVLVVSNGAVLQPNLDYTLDLAGTAIRFAEPPVGSLYLLYLGRELLVPSTIDSLRLDQLEFNSASKDYVDTRIFNLINNAPQALDTLNELAQALGEDANFSTTITNLLGQLDNRIDQIEGSDLSGAGTPNLLPKFGTENSLTDSLIYDDGLKIGIGTTDPQKLLDVNEDISVNGMTLGHGGGNVGTNIAFGLNALVNNVDGAFNIAIGAHSLWNNVASGNVAVGYNTLLYNTTGEYNTALGLFASHLNISGNENVAVGMMALRDNSIGLGNTAIGWNALETNTQDKNVALGHSAGSAITSGSNNVIIGGNTASHVNGRSGCISISDGAGVERIFIDESGVTDIKGGLTVNGLDISIENVLNSFSTSLIPSSGTLSVDLSLGKVVLGTLSDSVTTWSFTNVPSTNGKAVSVTVMLEGNSTRTYGDACSVNGIAITDGIKWVGSSAPTATNNTDIITFVIVRDNSGAIKVIGNSTLNIS